MRNLLKISAFSMIVAACGVESDNTDDVGADEAELSASSYSYVVGTRDFRKCSAPMCGGWFVKDVNKRTAEQYVSDLDLSRTAFDDETKNALRGAPDQVVFRAKLSAKDRAGFRKLIVASAWRGLPGVTATLSDSFYSVEDQRPFVRCAAAPCNAVIARKLGTSSVKRVTGLDVTAASMPNVQESWLENRITKHEALVAASITQGQQFPAGRELFLAASNVFIKIPEKIGPCAMPPLARCPRGETWSFERNEERCVMPVSCEQIRMCKIAAPSCEAGYTVRSWAGSGGCLTYACDPTWSLPAGTQ